MTISRAEFTIWVCQPGSTIFRNVKKVFGCGFGVGRARRARRGGLGQPALPFPGLEIGDERFSKAGKFRAEGTVASRRTAEALSVHVRTSVMTAPNLTPETLAQLPSMLDVEL